MRNHTTAYEEAIKTFGRQQAIRITFGNVVLTGDDINSCTPSFKASLLKSCMKEVRIDSNTEIPVGTEIHLEHGILVGNSYEYLDYGYYTVYKVEKKEDTSSFDILCYDKMILAMVDYIDLGIDFPITIRNYIAEICNHLEIDFGSNQDQFVNYDKEIPSELYLDENGDSLNYTFRDVLDEIAQVTASVICIDNENKLVVKYPERQGEFETLEGTALYIENADDTKIDLELKGNTIQNGTPTPSSPVAVNNVTGEQVVTIRGKNRFNLQKLISFGLGSRFSALDNGIISTIPESIDWYGNTPPITVSPTLNQRKTIYNYGISVTPEEQLTISFDNPNGTYAEVNVFYYDKDANYLSVQSLGARNNEQYVSSFSVRANTRYIMFRFDNEDYNHGAKQLNIQNIQLETGSQATSYEPYQGKDYEVNLGKNLFDKDKATTGGRLSNVNGTIYAESGYFYSNFIKVEPSTSYTKNSAIADVYHRVCFYSSASESGYISKSESNVFTTPNNCEYIRFCGIDTEINTTQLEKGTTPTTYAPYFTPIELNKIGDYQDYIKKGTGKNLADISQVVVGKTWSNQTNTQRATILYIPVKKGTNYSLVSKWTNSAITNIRAVFNLGPNDLTSNVVPNSYPYSNTLYDYASIEIIANTTFTSEMLEGVRIMFNEGQVENYEPYACTGKNLFDGQLELGMYDETGAKATNNTNYRNVEPINVQPRTTYTFSIDGISQKYVLYFYKGDGTFISVNASLTNGTFTTPAETYLLNFRCFNADFSSDYANLKIQLERGSTATSYEPYVYSTLKDKWYIEKNIEKIVLDGINNKLTYKHPSLTSETKGFYMFGLPNKILGGNGSTSYGISNYFSYIAQSSASQAFNNNTSGLWWEGSTNWNYMILEEASLSDANTWLTTHNTTIYYVLANPTYTLIENEELLNQLEAVQLQTGLNNVLVSGNLSSTIKVGYVEELKSIDEEQLKDINVNFGEKFGPINSVVIARAADSDFIYKEDEQSVEENGLCEIRISDNQILNGDSRVEFLNGIYYQLRGTEYYLNDFSSTGITYLDLLDYYKVNVFDNSYKCLMLNDDIKITQGIEEQVHTEMPETTETEYKALSKEGKDIRKTMILVDKVNGRITTEIADVNGNYSTLQGTVSSLSSRVKSTETAINGDDEDPNNPGLVKQVNKINSTMLTQDSSSFTAVVEQAQTAFDGVKAYDDDDNLQVIRKQIQFSQDGLTLSAEGTTSDDMKLHLTNEAIEFLYQNHAVLTINGSVIEFSNASFKKLDLGHYVWQAEDDDSLSLIYEGGN